MYPSTITKDEINALKLDQYEGKIHVISDESRVHGAIEKIKKHKVVGFDTESKPTFKRGEYNHVALVQIALPNDVYLFRINGMGISDSMIDFFEDQSIIKVGVALRDDLIDLKKIRKFKPASFQELNHLVKDIGIESNGLRKLVAIILGFRISKSAQVTNWEAPRLTKKQVQYAATDAWVCLEMYRQLEQKGYL